MKPYLRCTNLILNGELDELVIVGGRKGQVYILCLWGAGGSTISGTDINAIYERGLSELPDQSMFSTSAA